MATAFSMSCGANTYTNITSSSFASEFVTSNSRCNPPKSLKITVKEHRTFSSLSFTLNSAKRRNRTRISPIVSEIDNKDSDEEVHDAGVKAALSMLIFYKREISPILPKSCRYVPTCSEYSMIAYKKYGFVKGSVLTAWRLCRCNPLGGSGFDPPRWFDEERPTEE